MNSFQTMGLNPTIQTALEALNFITPTPIQAQTIPLALAGKDVLGSAQTGTGKTLAFTIPLVNKLLDNPSEMALVLVPTRELAQQVVTAIRQVTGKNRGLRSALLIGGDSFFKQLQQLRSDARIVVGTPGRVIDHLKRATLKPNLFHFLVLDETDRMFDMGFERQIDQIIQQLPQDRQTLMFSATLPPAIVKTASRYLIKPERVAIGDVSSPVAKIKQEVAFVGESEKEAKLIEELGKREESIVVFVKTKWNAEKLAKKLSTLDLKAIALHGDLRQNKRERVISAFRKGTYTILVATDIAARGLDIPQVRHIINFDLPQCPEDYIHRIGRTGRAGAEGFSLCLVTPKETKNWKIIDRFANTSDGITDNDRAALSHKPSRSGGRQGGGSRGGSFRGRSDSSSRGGRSDWGRSSSRDGGYEDRRRDSFDSRDKNSERTFTPRFGRGGERRPSFRKPFDADAPAAETSSDSHRPRFTSDRPAGDRRRPFRSDEDRPFFKRNRPFNDREQGRDFERPRRSRESFGERSEGSDRSDNRDDRFSPRKPFFRNTDGSFKKRDDRPFGQDFERKRRPHSEARDADGAPSRDRKPFFDRPFDKKKTYKRKKRD